ncbi:hypothetical protein PgNI_06377, partial [Pyricularia grisea]|uniref:Uncharacterized protein n=1 Tax=Pyricularia grisea TaxID=148305 RepID=A0A6P8B4D0_PYRGI
TKGKRRKKKKKKKVQKNPPSQEHASIPPQAHVQYSAVPLYYCTTVLLHARSSQPTTVAFTRHRVISV